MTLEGLAKPGNLAAQRISATWTYSSEFQTLHAHGFAASASELPERYLLGGPTRFFET